MAYADPVKNREYNRIYGAKHYATTKAVWAAHPELKAEALREKRIYVEKYKAEHPARYAESIGKSKAKYRAKNLEKINARDRELYRQRREDAKTDPVKAAALAVEKANDRKNMANQRAANPELLRQRGRDFYNAHKNDERVKESVRKSQKKGREKLKNNPERLKAYKDKAREHGRKWRLKNAEKIRAYDRTPQMVIRRRVRSRIRHALKNGGVKLNSTIEALGCSIPELKAHLESQFLPGMTWENRGEWQIDHIRPCASFNLLDPEQYRCCLHFSNLQPLWAADNRSKGSKCL